jgi:fibro-slime domain-containing protein
MSTKLLHPFACLSLLLALGACEGRTAMRISPCSPEGATRACTDTCGAGVQTCVGSSWTGCVVAPVRSSCTNTCGAGTRMCQNNQLASACDVDPIRLPCSNTCGDGTQLCQNNLKVVCEVDAVRLPCSNTCGDGTQLCENNQRKGVCEVAPVVKDCSTICGPGNLTCADNKWQACTATQPKSPALTATIRDFHISFPDMNHDGIAETGIVATQLGDDDKPVYAHTGSTATVVGPDTFNQWYHDVAGVNISTTIPIPLTPSNSSKGVYTYNNTSFFPIDDQLFGDEGQSHNYAFTAEVAAKFRYSGGETFTFAGDDDVFVFINRQLAIDLGGIHSMLTQTVDLDAQAGNLGLTKGQIYPMHIFFAERHPIGSDFVIETTISEFDACK